MKEETGNACLIVGLQPVNVISDLSLSLWTARGCECKENKTVEP